MSSPCTIEVRRAIKIQESRERPIYCIAWSKDRRRLQPQGSRAPFFAAVGGRCVSFYSHDEQDDGKGEAIELFQSYKDNDRKEDFYTCVFAGRSAVNGIMPETQHDSSNDAAEAVPSSSPSPPALDPNLVYSTPSTRERGAHHYWPLAGITGDGAQLLCVAGKSGVIKVLDPVQCQFISFLLGHGDEIYDLKVAPPDEHLLISASKDRSCRIWNLHTGGCVAILKGTKYGHNDAIDSVAWHPKAELIATASLDTTVKLWKASTGVPLREAIRQSHVDAQAFKEKRLQRVVDPLVVAVPHFSSSQLHMKGVDWYVSFVSVSMQIFSWHSGTHRLSCSSGLTIFHTHRSAAFSLWVI